MSVHSGQPFYACLLETSWHPPRDSSGGHSPECPQVEDLGTNNSQGASRGHVGLWGLQWPQELPEMRQLEGEQCI